MSDFHGNPSTAWSKEDLVGYTNDDMKPLAIIPARGGSKRFPRKNVALLGGKPLILWAVEAAMGSGVFDTVCVSSDDAEILKIAEEAGAEARLRPQEFATDTAQTKHVSLHLLEELAKEGKEYESIALLMPTSPLRSAEDIRKAYEIFEETGCDCVMSFVPNEHPPEQTYHIVDGKMQPYLGIEKMHIRSQELPKTYRHDGAITFVKTDVFRKRKEWCDTGVVPYFIPPEHSVDIDSPTQLKWAEFLLSHS